MYRLLHWLDENILFFLTGFLLAFIPLFPKLPLFEAIPGYIVRVRIEDFLIAFTLVVWLIQLGRKKVTFGPNPLTRPIIAYLCVGVFSMLSAVFIIQTVPFEPLHVGKMLLHFLRRVEYFSLFFVFYSAIKSVKQVKIYLGILVGTIIAVTLYGFGQKYLYWPAFSTMNREFAKGWVLYLTQHARVLSTFGGHYDLAAFAMMALIILWGLFFSIEKKVVRFGIFLVLSGVFWLLILTASRTSFIAYIVGTSVLFFIWSFIKGMRWAVVRWFGIIALSIFIMLSFGDLSDRFTKLLKLDQRFGGIKSLLLRPISAPPKDDEIAFLENNLEAVTSKSDFPPLPVRPTDVIEELPDGVIATESATGAAIRKVIPRTYSKTALVYDLSTGIRLDALWPRAIAGFKRNPLLGSGYSTLTKTQFSEFTEAESTDNDFLRALGETGILGFLAFGWILASVVVYIWKAFPMVRDRVHLGFLLSMVAVIAALLVNAVYIDIFEASKVALSFWALVGIVLGLIKVLRINTKGKLIIPKIPDVRETMEVVKKYLKIIRASDWTVFILIAVLAFSLRYYKIHTPLADWHSWRQADTSAVTRNFVRYGTDPLFPRYDDLSSVASGKPNPEGYRFVEFPLYNIFAVITDKLFPGYSVEYSGRLTSVFASLGSLLFLFLISRKYLGRRIGLLTAFYFSVLPYNIFWSRTILPEPTLVFLTTGLLYFFDKWADTQKWWYWIVGLIFASLALLVKFTTIFFSLPLLYLVWRKWGSKMFSSLWLYLFAFLMLLPFVAWRVHITRFPEGVPAYGWLFNGNGIRFKGAWFWWLFSERIAKLILGGWGIGLLTLGIVTPIKTRLDFVKSLVARFKHAPLYNWFFHWWLLGLLVYLAVFATGNVQHDYYQIILIPILAVFLARGTDALLNHGTFHPLVAKSFLVVATVFMLMFGWYQVRDLYNINHPEIVEAGRKFDRLVSNTRVKVIAPYGGDTAFLYQTGRRGWPIIEGTIEEMINKGAHYYISTNFDGVTTELIDTARQVEIGKDPKHSYKIIELTDTFVIIQLVPDRLLPKS